MKKQMLIQVEFSEREAKEYLARQMVEQYEREHRIARGRLAGKQRGHEITRHRVRCMRLVREVLGLSWKGLGRVFNRDHSSVMHHLKNKGYQNHVQLSR